MKNESVKKRNYVNINRLKVLFFAVTIALFTLTSCGGDDVIAAATGCETWSKTLETSVTKWSEASANYSNNPTSENCNKYKDAGLDYVKAIQSVSKCIPGTSKTFYEDALKDLKDELNSINCN